MVLAKSKKAVGLGNSLMNDRFGGGRGADQRRAGRGRGRGSGPNGEAYISEPPKEASWVKMRSVTEQAALDEFLSTAELADTDFTAEKMNNVRVIHPDQRNPYLLSAADERARIGKHKARANRLTVPRRPPWDETTTPAELDTKEKAAFLDWRRGLAELQEVDDLLMTPFERNLEVWRQLWRVIERSDLVVQIVDARNPLMFRSEDLERYVKEVDSRKNNLLLVNKADMMTLKQREAWAECFKEKGIRFRFFSAALAKQAIEAEMEEGSEDGIGGSHEEDESDESDEVDDLAEEDANLDIDMKEEEEGLSVGEEDHQEDVVMDGAEDEDESTRILTVDELEALFLEHAPEIEDTDSENARKITVGLVGYPNVGKSSTINALVGAKKVSVSATPGKTKHFQTIHLSPSVVLCDCPGLVFPNFATTKAELVCNGVLPIDQLREFTGPVSLVAQRIPQPFLEAMYGIQIHIRAEEEGGTGVPTAEELLVAYARARGFTKTGLGQPDESRAARYILKDYVKGKILFCIPPPADPPIDPQDFNRDLYDEAHLPQKRRAQLALAEEFGEGNEDASLMDESVMSGNAPQEGAKTARLDKKFFGPRQSNAGHLSTPYGRQQQQQQATASGKQLSGRKYRTMVALEKNIDPEDVKMMTGKRHFKGGKRAAKKGKGKGVEDEH